MVRELDQFAGRTFDVLVVGGGIYGLTIAYDAAQRGLSVGLIEREDFGCGSSFSHLRTIHGGLRYLQTLSLRRARESVLERRTLARIAPHAVQPVAFALPLARSVTSGKTAMRAGFLLDRIVGAGRNRRVPPALHLDAGHVLSRTDAGDRFPTLCRPGVTGIALWYDYLTLESDRLTLGWALAADHAGAILANHVEATAPLVEGRRVIGVCALDKVTGQDITVRARVTVNATGGALDRLLAPLGVSTRIPMITAMNLVTRRAAPDAALGGRSGSGQTLFQVPWRGRALFGTWQSPRVCAPGDPRVTGSDVAAFLAQVNQAFPGLDLRTRDVSLVHRGVVPARVGSTGAVTLEAREQLRDHAEDGITGLFSVAGTKYTTARAVAERVTSRLLRLLNRPATACRTATRVLPGGDVGALAGAVADASREDCHDLPHETISHLVAAYGSRYRDVLAVADTRPEWRARVAEDSPVIAAQLIWAVRREMATTLADALIRRTPLGALGYPGDDATERAAVVVGNELGWSVERRQMEIGQVRVFYETAAD